MKRTLLMFGMLACWTLSYGQLTAPFLESFNSTSIPSGWTNNTTDPWKFGGTMGYDAASITDHTGQPNSTYAWLDGSGSTNASAPLVTDSINMSALTNPELTFYLSSYNLTYASSGYNTFRVDFYDGSTWHDSVYVHSGNLTNWTKVVVNLTSYTITGKCLVRFDINTTTSTTAFYNDIAIDDVRVANQPTCPEPSNLSSSASTSSSATLSWTSGGALNWQVEYGALGYTAGTGTKVAATSNTNFVLSGLSPATNYDIYVRDSCGATDKSFWVGPINVTTLCVNSMNGTYTLNQTLPSSATNLASFNELETALNTCGISGPVTVNVVAGSGPYNEKISISNITGSSSTNTVTINGNGETIVDSGSGGNYAIVLLDGADYVTIDSLNILGYASSSQFALQFMNGANHNIIRNSRLEVRSDVTTSLVANVVFSNSATSNSSYGDNGNYNLLENNEIIGGYYGIRHNGISSTTGTVGNQFVGNTISDFSVYGIYNYYQDSVIIKNNDINRSNRGGVTTGYAIYNGYVKKSSEISSNWIHNMFAQATGSTGTFYGIYCFSSDAAVGEEVMVTNNLITNNDNSGTSYYLYNSSSDNWRYYHNTVAQLSPGISGTGSTRGIYHTSSVTGVEYKNNLIYLDRGTSGTNHLVYTTVNTGADFDNNAYYMPQAGTGSNYYGYYSGNHSSFTDWQAASTGAFDQNSASGDPFFVDPSINDYIPRAAYFDNIGANVLAMVATDYNGMARTITPDPGAFEFSPPLGPDLAITGIYKDGNACGTSANVLVQVINQGTDSVTSFTMNYSINGVAATPIALTGKWLTGVYDTVTLLNIPIGTTVTSVVAGISAVSPGLETDLTNNSDSIQLRSGISGTFTLNSGMPNSSTNYNSFSSLANDLNNYGVCGPVVVNVAGTSVTYSDQLYLTQIDGASSVNTITINGNGNTLDYVSTNSSSRGTVVLDGADWVTIDSLNIIASGTGTSEYGVGIQFTNSADHNTIRNCNVTVDAVTSSSNYAGITISGSLSSPTQQGISGNYNTIEGTIISGGYYGVTSLGTSTDSANSNAFINCSIEDFYYYGMYFWYNDHPVIEGNEISRLNRTTVSSFYGIYVYYSTSAHIIGNKVHDPFATNTTSTSTLYPAYLYYPTGTSSDPVLITNNLFYNLESDGTLYGLYISQGSEVKILNNTMVLDDPNNASTSTFTNTRLLYIASAIPGGVIANNLFYMNRATGGTPYLAYMSGAVSEMDYNTFYGPTGGNTFTFGYYNNSAVTDFSSWQTTTGLDANSNTGNPYFVNTGTGDYHPQSALLDASGKDFSPWVTTDIDGTLRGTVPDIGAYEFVSLPCTGLSGIGVTATSATSGTIGWVSNPAGVTIEWGPIGYKQASQAPDSSFAIAANGSSALLTGLTPLTCYDYYLTMNCTSTLPGAPPVMGPYTVCTDCPGGPMSGTYTVGGIPGPTDFPTLDSAITMLNGCGINGPVVINLSGGTHNGFVLDDIDGSSALNTITFNGSTVNNDSIVAGPSATAAVELNGSQHIFFNDLYIVNTSGNYVVWMHNATQYISIEDCFLLGNGTTQSSATAVVAASSSATSAITYGDNASHVTIKGSRISGNYYGVVINGSGTTAKARGIVIEDNNFANNYYYGIRLYYTDSVTVKDNYIPGFRNGFSYGLYGWYTDNLHVSENQFYGCGTYAFYLYYSNYLGHTPGSNSSVINNMFESSGTGGMYTYGNNDIKYYHNSVQSSGLYTFYLSGTANSVDVRNNILDNTGTGTAMYISIEPTSYILDYNLYNSGGNIGYVGATGYASLAAWQTATPTRNANSLEGSPGFIAANDFHTISTLVNDTGDNSVGVLIDLDNDPRPLHVGGKVDIGADEFDPPNCDRPDSLYVVSVSSTAIVVGWSGGTSAPYYDVSAGVGGYTVGNPANITRNLTTNSFTITNPGPNVIYDVYIRSKCTVTDSSFWSDKLSVGLPTVPCDNFEAYEVRNLQNQSSLVYGWSNVGGDGEISTTYASSGTKSMHIYDSGPNNFTDMVVVTDTSYTTGVHNIQFDYYMPVGSGGYYNILHNYTGLTNVWAIEVYIDANGTAVVNAGTNSSAIAGSYNINLGAWNTIEHIIDLTNDTAYVIVNGAKSNFGWQWSWGSANMGDRFNAVNFYSAANPNQTPNYYIDDFCITPYTPPSCFPPTALAVSSTNIGCDSAEVSWASVSTNLNSVLEYGPTGFTPGSGTTVPGYVSSPYVITGLMPGTTYDVYVADTCGGGDTSTAVGPIVFSTDAAKQAHASFTHSSTFAGNTQNITFDASGSSNADTYTWDFGNGNSGSGMLPPIEVYNLPNAAVSVKLTVTNACGSTDDTTIVIQTTIGLDEPDFAHSLSLFPNPTNGDVNISFNKPSGGELSFEIINANGQKVYFEDLGSLGGQYDGAIDLSEFAPGVYILRIDSDLGVVNRRLTKL